MSYRYLAFVDLLGYRELLKQDIGSGEETLKHKLTNSFTALANINEAEVHLKAISDSIFVTLTDNNLGFEFFADVLRQLQVSFLNNDLLLRGGVSFGQHFENNKVTYSHALVDAYQLESNNAFFPRILVHEAVIAKLRNESLFDAVIRKKLIVSHAGNYQIHFLTEGNWANCYEKLKELSKIHETLLLKDPRVYSKYWFLQEYLSAYKPKRKIFRRYLPSWDK